MYPVLNGLGDSNKGFIELYHQDGAHHGRRTKVLSNYKQKHESQHKADHRSSHPKVHKVKENIREKRKLPIKKFSQGKDRRE